jgi:hypothetical protein
MTSAKKLAIGVGLVVLTLFGTMSAAHAQYGAPPPYYPPPPPRVSYRHGLLLGFGIGGGAITANDCTNCGGGAGGLEFHIGGMINPQLAIMFEIWGLARPLGDGFSLTQSIYTGSLQFWATPQFWLKGGLGGGTIDISDNYSGASFDAQSAFAVSGALGYEVLQFANFALDLQFRLAHAAYDGGGANNVAVMIGFNWY